MKHTRWRPFGNLIPMIALVLAGMLIAIGCGKTNPGSNATNQSTTPTETSSTTEAPIARDITKVGGIDVAGQPRILPIVIQPPTIDIGLVSPGKIAHGEVDILNIGDEPITILRSAPSCQCTSVDLANQVIEPGKMIKLPAEFDAGYRLGTRTATVRLIFEGYDQVIDVPVTAEVALAVRADPSIIRDQVPNTNDYVDALEYTVESVDGQPFQVLAVQDEPPPFVDFNPAIDTPRNHYRLRFDFSRYDEQTCMDEMGRLMPAFLAIQTDHPDCSLFDIRVRTTCTTYERTEPGQNWVLAERRTLLGALAPGESKEFNVELKWRPGTVKDDRVVEVVTNSKQFTSSLIDVFQEQGNTVYRVRITPNPGFSGLLYDTVRFRSPRYDMSMFIIGHVGEADELADE